jgi:hypothetical protein
MSVCACVSAQLRMAGETSTELSLFNQSRYNKAADYTNTENVLIAWMHLWHCRGILKQKNGQTFHVVTCMIYRRTKLHVAFFTCHFTSHEKRAEQNFRSEFQGSLLRDIRVAPSSETDMASMQVVLMIRIYKLRMSGNLQQYDFYTEFRKIRHLVQKQRGKGQHTHSYLQSILWANHSIWHSKLTPFNRNESFVPFLHQANNCILSLHRAYINQSVRPGNSLSSQWVICLFSTSG